MLISRMIDAGQSPNILSWRVAVLGGAMWGVALAGLEMSVELSDWAGIRHLAYSLIGLALVWCLTGLGWATITKSAKPSLPIKWLAVVWLGGAAILTAAQIGMIHLPYIHLFDDIRDFPLDAMFLHILWLNGFYGGLYILGFNSFNRSLTSRQRMSRLHQLLSEEAALLSEARLKDMHSQIQPRILVDALAAAKARYRLRPAAADRLVEQLINFLRSVSARSNGGLPMAQDELSLATMYVKLQAAVREPEGEWSARASAPTPAIPFPRSLLLPLIEEMGRTATRVELTSGNRSSAFFIEVVATKPRDHPMMPLRLSAATEMPKRQSADTFPWTFTTANVGRKSIWTAIVSRTTQELCLRS